MYGIECGCAMVRYFTIDFDAHIIFYSHSVLQKKAEDFAKQKPSLGAGFITLKW
jgi:hypothetical protein